MRASVRRPDTDFSTTDSWPLNSVGPYQLFMAVGAEGLQPHHVDGQIQPRRSDSGMQ